jgi:hypothetical protein
MNAFYSIHNKNTVIFPDQVVYTMVGITKGNDIMNSSEPLPYELLQVGTDAELFLTNSKNEPVPVCGLVGGTKEEPLPVM